MTYDEQQGLEPAPFADLFGEADDLFEVSSVRSQAPNVCFCMLCRALLLAI